jgi:hypothetical protein
MKLPISIAESLLIMQKGEKIPFSQVKSTTVETMIDNGILKKQILGRTKSFVYLTDVGRLGTYLHNHFGIENLEMYVEGLKRDDLTRAEAIDISSNSKLKSVRTFKGFLVNCFQPVECILNNEKITIQPQEGTFIFIYDFEKFFPDDGITIVGIENPSNFRYVQKQRKLFDTIQPLFVSRYPQTKDLVRWLQVIPNRYLHFGDFDFSGLNIYINEYKRHLQEKADYFLPPDIEMLLESKGNRDNYARQTILFDTNQVKEENVEKLLELIEKYKKGLEQEIFAK